MGKIEYKRGNLLAIKAGFIAHGCNALGVMSSGIAKQIKQAYPLCFDKYYATTSRNRGTIGYCIPYFQGELCIINMITQKDYGNESGKQYVNYTALHKCFREADTQIETLAQKSSGNRVINIPMIGAGLGGGNWDEIEKIIELATPHIHVICWSL